MQHRVVGTVLGIVAMSLAAQSTLAQQDCATLTGFSLAGTQLEISRAEQLTAGPAPGNEFRRGYTGDIPAHCRVEGTIDKRIGVNGTPYGIGFALALPNDWNGRFLFQGGGGLNGSVGLPLGAAAAGETPALARGFAVVTTDSGHEGAVFDGSFFADQEATLNFLYLAVGRVTIVAKAIVAAHYGQATNRAYFAGCSTGGREGMIMSQRFPNYFDGIIAGAPAMRTGYSNIGMRWVSVSLSQAAERDTNGTPMPGTSLSAGDRKLIVDSAMASCDADDGIVDGMLFNTAACSFDPGELVCAGQNTNQCLRLEQVDAVKRAMSGPRASNGEPVYVGYLYDSGIAATGSGAIPGLLNGAASPVGGPTPPTEQDVDAEALAAAAEPSALGNSHSWTNLSSFLGSGRKLLFYHGVSDPWFSVVDTIEYYDKLGRTNSAAASVNDWSRLYLVPGMGHCGGGTQTLNRFDLLSAVVDWVENGVEPDSITATGSAYPERSRPLCSYPNYAHYTGSGDPEEASSFECR